MVKTIRLIILSILLTAVNAFAWQPTKPIRVILGFTPGSGNEVSFRGVEAVLQKQYPNLNFIIEHRPGVDSIIATNYFAKQPADGYTISIPSEQGTFVTALVWNKPVVQFDPFEFEFVTSIAQSPLCLVAKIDSPVNTVSELIETLKNPNRNINFAVGGGAHQVAYEYLTDSINATSSRLQAVKFKGPNPAVLSVASGETEFGIMPIAIARPLIEGKKVKLIGIAGDRKMPAYPNTPLLKDFVPGLVVNAGWVIVLPKETPKEIVNWYVNAFVPAIRSAEAKVYFDNNLMIVNENQLGPEKAKNAMINLRDKWQPIVRKMKVD
jgi:tripartite-type tricarboxylate transporter receptor subunit TctC